MADIELDNPLCRKQIGSDFSTYYIAYGSVLLRPDTPVPAQFHGEFPNTVIVGVPADKPKLNVYAEEIVFLTGSSYAFPATHLTINCRSIAFCDADSGHVTFDLSGVAGTGQKTDGTPPLNALPATYKLINDTKQWEWDWLGEYNSPSNLSDEIPAEQGVRGGTGSEGMPGTPGGSFTLTCDVNCKDTDVGKYSVLIKTHGSAGFPGGNGSKGGKGGDAVTIMSPRSLLPDDPTTDTCSPRAFFLLAPLLQPGYGGSGGDAGPGGYGGNGGDINVSFLLNSQQPSVEQAKKLFQLDASAGPSGPDGVPGDVGDLGDPAKFKLTASLINDYTGQEGRKRWKQWTGFDVTNSNGDFLLPYISEVYPSGESNLKATRLSIDMSRMQPRGTAPSEGVVLGRTDTSRRLPTTGNINLQCLAGMNKLYNTFPGDCRYLSMILDRLKFEHYLFFTIQKYTSSDKSDPINANMRDACLITYEKSKAWISSIIENINTQSVMSTTATDLQKLQLRSLQSTYIDFQDLTDRGLDIYRNGPDDVPEPSLCIADMEKSNEKYVKLEQILAGVSTALNKAESLVEGERVKLVTILKDVHSTMDKQSDILAQLSPLEIQIVAADGVIQSKKLDLESALITVKQKFAAQVNCDFDDILSALSTLCLFYNPEADAMYAIGVIANGGDSISKTVQRLDTLPSEIGGTVNKTYLYSRITTMTEDTTTPLETLKQEFARAKGAKGHDFNYLSQVRMQESKFNELCAQYYEIEGIKSAKAAFQQFINAIQVKSDLLDEYNQVFIKLANLQLQTDTLNATVNALQQKPDSEQNQTDALQIANTFLEQTRSTMKRLMLYNLYNVIRTFNYISMTYSQLVMPLASLKSFVGLDSVTLSANYNTYFVDGDIHRLRNMYNTYKSSNERVILEVEREKYSSVFEALEETGVFTFTLDPELVCQLGPRSVQENWFDVRYSTAEIYFVGATCIPKDSNLIHTTITTSGSSKVLDSNLALHKFKLPEANVGFSYTYDLKSDRKRPLEALHLKPYSNQVMADVVRYELEPGHQVDIYLQSPMTTWHSEITGYHSEAEMKKNPELVSKVDLKNCTAVQFRFMAMYRSTSMGRVPAGG